jgi:uncharacterized protein YjbI with pentapeptide repeats
MGAMLRAWWEQMQKYRRAIGVVVIVLIVVVVIALMIVVVLSNGSGFNGYNKVSTVHTISGPSAGTVTRTEEYQPGKTLWDLLQLLAALAIPVVVGLGAAWYTAQQRKVSESETRDNQRHATLQAYLDKMSELLLNGNLAEQTADGQLNPEYKRGCLVARVRTITVLTQLDARRISYVFAFLREAELMSATKDDNAISLKNADLHAVDWSQADLCGADLRGANLSGANLSGAIFFSIIYVPRAFGSTIVIPNHANLSGADLSGANLRGAKVTDEQLATAKSLQGATMPDGKINQ